MNNLILQQRLIKLRYVQVIHFVQMDNQHLSFDRNRQANQLHRINNIGIELNSIVVNLFIFLMRISLLIRLIVHSFLDQNYEPGPPPAYYPEEYYEEETVSRRRGLSVNKYSKDLFFP